MCQTDFYNTLKKIDIDIQFVKSGFYYEISKTIINYLTLQPF
jgi:hypothetical protein